MMHWRLRRWREAWEARKVRLRWRLRWGASVADPPPAPLETPTFDGSGQATHPDVLCPKRPWNGHRWWMVMTPFPFNQEGLENPSLLVSDDGRRWEVPPGVVNPLVPTPKHGFHADPDALLSPDGRSLWIYYLHTIRHQDQRLLRLVSDDGRLWRGPETLLTVPYQEIRSPAIVHWSEGGDGTAEGWFLMWCVDMTGGDAPRIVWRKSRDGAVWSPPWPVKFDRPGWFPSHLDVQWDGWRGAFVMVAQLAPEGGGGQALYLAQSRDGIDWRIGRRPLLAPWDAPPWASLTLYRASLLPRDDGGLDLWYGARGPGNVNRIAFLALAATMVEKALRWE
ncbi:MAG: hypothetical protein HQL51_14435 [Magnetococcales bacterium]|nr:hypothetical protein [Magnetococcales bacterium]